MDGGSRTALVVVIAFEHPVEEVQSDSLQVTTASHVVVHIALPSYKTGVSMECLRVFGT